jgi:uncharacterized protein (TIGR02679 family)
VSDTERAAARLARPELDPVVDELLRRLGESSATPVKLTLRGLQPEARAALADLLGMARLPPVDSRLDVGRLAGALGLSDRESVRIVVETLRGPVRDRRAERLAERQSREALWNWFTGRCEALSIRGLGPVRGWPAGVRNDGVRGSVDEHRRRLAGALDVLGRLDSDAETSTPLAVLANEVLGDPHALDSIRPVARLVTGAIADAAGLGRPATAEEVRAAWELVGVVPDPLSSNVLVLGLEVAPEHPLASMLQHHREASEPVVLTLSQLQRWPVDALTTNRSAYVIENPALIAAAAARRWIGPLIVCSSGRPSVAVVTLLRQLGQSSYQHADFDVAGVGITTWLCEHAGTIPWRMTSSDYLAVASARNDRPRLRGVVPTTRWDPDLAEAMNEEGVAVFEEEIADRLLDDMLSS